MQDIEQKKRKTELPVSVWVILFVAGIVVAGMGRFFGWRENPSHIWHEWAPLATVVLAVFICIFGYSRFAKGNENRDFAKKWTGVILIILGLTIIGTSFLFRFIVPSVFG
jgi:H+/Cl- antiporter ClcA